MTALAPMTRLDAVNAMLLSVGQAPVNTLGSSGLTEVAVAEQVLDESIRAVQAEGWWFNTSTAKELTPDANGYILLPQNVLSVDPIDPTAHYVERVDPSDGLRKLYNVDEETWVFDKPVECRVVWMFDFEELPQAARTYITYRAARRFQAQTVGSEVLYRFTAQDEEIARAALRREHLRARDANFLRSAPTSIRRIFVR